MPRAHQAGVPLGARRQDEEHDVEDLPSRAAGRLRRYRLVLEQQLERNVFKETFFLVPPSIMCLLPPWSTTRAKGARCTTEGGNRPCSKIVFFHTGNLYTEGALLPTQQALVVNLSCAVLFCFAPAKTVCVRKRETNSSTSEGHCPAQKEN